MKLKLGQSIVYQMNLGSRGCKEPYKHINGTMKCKGNKRSIIKSMQVSQRMKLVKNRSQMDFISHD